MIVSTACKSGSFGGQRTARLTHDERLLVVRLFKYSIKTKPDEYEKIYHYFFRWLPGYAIELFYAKCCSRRSGRFSRRLSSMESYQNSPGGRQQSCLAKIWWFQSLLCQRQGAGRISHQQMA